nr:hypothetical protein [uncultured Cardiobacterium sp.]
MKKTLPAILIAALALATQSTAAPLTLAEQGSFTVGGTVKKSEGTYTPIPAEIAARSGGDFWDAHRAAVAAGGMTMHGDHASVFYQIPVDARKTPLIFLHGYGQSARGWMTTPDGRAGFNELFLRKTLSRLSR